MAQAKSFDVSKREVWDAYKRVKANRGAEGVDGVTLSEFDQELSQNLYWIWNRLASGSYIPPPVKRVEIAKEPGKTRPLGIPTVSDRIAQMVVQRRLTPLLEPVFHEDSYGYRPGRSAHDALKQARRRCWDHDWVLDLDIKGFFDNIDWTLMMEAVRRHTTCPWVVLYIQRWLRAAVVMPSGEVVERDKGTPQGGVISPILANLYLHYAFDKWMGERHPQVKFERYADDVICHCDSQVQAQSLRAQLERRMAKCKLELHPEKTRVVYCADANRRAGHRDCKFDFLGYTFKPRAARNRWGKVFTNFSPGVSEKAAKGMRKEIRDWRLQRKSRYSMDELVAKHRPALTGWVNYYGKFQPSSLWRGLLSLDHHLMQWARGKFKKLRYHCQAGWNWLKDLQARTPTLWPHWRESIMTTRR